MTLHKEGLITSDIRTGLPGTGQTRADRAPGRGANRSPVLLVGSHWGHIGRRSGLSPLAEQLRVLLGAERVAPSAGDRARVTARMGYAWAAERVLGRKPSRRWSPFYNRQGALLETASRRLIANSGCREVFFEALEDHFNVFGVDRAGVEGLSISGLSHQPPAWWRMHGLAPSLLQSVDRLIVLSTEAERFFREEGGHPCVQFIPHGVDASFFHPPPSRTLPLTGPIDVLFCGQWLRDFRQLEATLETLGATRAFRFHLVIPAFARNFDRHYRIARHPHVRWYSGLSDEALRDLYQRMHLLFLPLVDATANNTVLEAMASGLPIIVSRVGGVEDYLSPERATFLASASGEDGAAALEACASRYGECLDKAAAARQYAETSLNWALIAARMAEVIRNTSDEPRRTGI